MDVLLFKKGDVLVAISDCVMHPTGNRAITSGEEYTVEKTFYYESEKEHVIQITNDLKETHYFSNESGCADESVSASTYFTLKEEPVVLSAGMLLLAIDPCVMEDGSGETLVVGNIYTITHTTASLEGTFIHIIDAVGDNHRFATWEGCSEEESWATYFQPAGAQEVDHVPTLH